MPVTQVPRKEPLFINPTNSVKQYNNLGDVMWAGSSHRINISSITYHSVLFKFIIHATINYMSTKSETNPQKRIPQINHQKQAIWQIYLPMLVFILIILALSVFIAAGSPASTGLNEKLAHLATLYLMTPVLIGSIPVLALLIGLIYLVSKIFPYIPKYGALISEKIDIVKSYIEQGMDLASQPFIKVPALFSGLQNMITGLIATLRRIYSHEE
jgi:hypothetical protein